MGGSFNTAIKSGVGYKAGVVKWVIQHSDVRELAASCPFFKPMMLTIAKMITADSNSGIKTRLAVATVFTYMDVTTDFIMMRKYFLQGRMGTFLVCLAIMIFHSLLQLLCSFGQNRKNKKSCSRCGVSPSSS